MTAIIETIELSHIKLMFRTELLRCAAYFRFAAFSEADIGIDHTLALK